MLEKPDVTMSEAPFWLCEQRPHPSSLLCESGGCSSNSAVFVDLDFEREAIGYFDGEMVVEEEEMVAA